MIAILGWLIALYIYWRLIRRFGFIKTLVGVSVLVLICDALSFMAKM